MGKRKTRLADAGGSHAGRTPASPAEPDVHLLIVDGHSVIFAWKSLRDLHARNPPAARERLAASLTRYQDASGDHLVLVFDGRGSAVGDSSDPAGIQVFYSKSGQTADAVIERLVAKYAARYRVTVATDDRLERTTVEAFGGGWISSESLAAQLEEAEREVADFVERLAKRPRT